ncbi:MAG: hypothetical protein H7Z39_16480, partial [Burkholderiaceae bacterium]|nr:hypothetical protein [Burkholderiaceae bacterium]
FDAEIQKDFDEKVGGGFELFDVVLGLGCGVGFVEDVHRGRDGGCGHTGVASFAAPERHLVLVAVLAALGRRGR